MITETNLLHPLLLRKYVEHFERTMLVQPIEHILSEQQALELLVQLQQKTKNNPWLFQPVGITNFQQQYAIVYEDFLGQSLQQYQQQHQLSLHEIIQIALELTNACISFHQQGETIEYFSPRLIAIQPKRHKIKLVAPMTAKRAVTNMHAHNIQEAVYNAPEQTGRVVAEIDERTDLYILGTILFELITKKPLFQADNIGDALFFVLTKTPDEHLLEEHCQLKILQDITLKLLRKDKVERYQSAIGLRHDLHKAMDLLIQHQFNAYFALGEQDLPLLPMFSSKLYGRESEQIVLQQAYNKAKAGNKEIVFIKGISGIGKSFLAKSLMKQIINDHNYFLESKFEQLQEQHSFQPIVEPLRKLLQQIYLEGEQSIESFQIKMHEMELILTDSLILLIPELEWFINEEFRIVQESKQYTLQLNAIIFASIEKILHIFALLKKTLVIFIDDMQWAETEVIQILEQIYNQYEGGHLLIIIASRDEICHANNELLLWQKELSAFSAIQVHLLSQNHIFSIVSDALKSQCETAHIVAQRIFQMTQGNPLFVHEVLRIFIKDKTVFYHLEKGLWEYDVEKLYQNIGNTDLFSFIESRMNMLSEASLSLLQIASCFGHNFDFELLLKLVNAPYYEILSNLEELISNGFIQALDTLLDFKHESIIENSQQLNAMKFQFVHDRIQQAAYEMLPHDVRLKTHFSISQLLQREDVRENQLQALVRQLNQCMELLSATEHQQLALWNYELGIKAKNAGLYSNARLYFNQSLRFLPEEKWISMREETIQIYMDIGECEYLVGNYEQSKNYIFEALSHAKSKLEKLKIYRLMSLIFIEEENSELVLNAGLQAMELCNLNIKIEPKTWEVAKEFILVKMALRNKTNEQLLNLKPIENEEIDVVIQIMINIVSNSFRISQNLTGLILLRLMRLQLQYGAPTESAIVFINYSLLLISGSNDVKEALRYGKLAVSMAEETENTYIKSRVYFIYSIFLNHWENDFETSIRYMRNVQQNMEQLGLYYNVTAMSCFLCSAKLLDGRSLEEISEELSLQQNLYGKYPSVLAVDFLEEFKYWVRVLKSPSAELIWNSHITLKNDEAVLVMHYTLRLRMAYLFKNETQIKSLLQDLAKQSEEVYSLPTTPIYHFFRTLCYFDFLQGRQSHSFSKNVFRKEIAASLRHFKHWSKHAPHQYEHIYMTLVAEEYAYKKQYKKATQAYNEALQLAEIYQFCHDAAVIHERMALLYMNQLETTKATYHITQGIEKLREWGATTIANNWEQDYSDYITTRVVKSLPILSYDMINLFDATHLLANEDFNIEQLLQQMLKTMLKQANATSGYFVRYINQQYSILANATSNQQPIPISLPAQLTEPSMKIIFDYVLQLGEVFVIGNLEKDPSYKHMKRSTKSVLCMPIKYKGKIQAFLYLENQLLVNAFSNVQLELLRLIATQMAVSLENLEIYNELENRVKERTATLDQMNVSLKEVNERLAINEQERKKLLQSISHELRSPLTSTLGYIESILDGVVNEKEQQMYYLRRSHDRLISLNRLIQDLFELAKLEAGRMDFTFNTLTVQEFFEHFAYRFESNVLEANLAYSASGNLEPNSYVNVDLLRVEQVISNLVSNAIKYTEKGRVALKMSIEEEELVCIIEDSGIGIPEHELPFIFDSYFRASNSNILNSHGIGLAICKEIISQHNGKIYADSNDMGSRFYFTMPIQH
ncbi:ATP-binding protein [Solibacillus daqui]|uniref:sensor histidine kinase n=1 Tax=Solibacillus daqui TaxID=2912187 RepID=UPI002366BACB|nr:ATP-binding protein [Solibacillus daqui]